MYNYLNQTFSIQIRFIEVQTESCLYVKTVWLVQRGFERCEGDVGWCWWAQDQMILHATSIDQNWHEFTPTASITTSQRSKKRADLVFIKIILIIKEESSQHVSCRPTQADDDINNEPVSVREKLCQGTRSYTEGGKARILSNVWLSVNNWTRSSCKNRPALLSPGLIHLSSEDWGIMMERPGDISHTDQRSGCSHTPVSQHINLGNSRNLWHPTDGRISFYQTESKPPTLAEFKNIRIRQ